jgi:hypothetical protein
LKILYAKDLAPWGNFSLCNCVTISMNVWYQWRLFLAHTHSGITNYSAYRVFPAIITNVLYLCFRFCIFDTFILEECFVGWKGPTPTLVMLTCNAKWPSSSYS